MRFLTLCAAAMLVATLAGASPTPDMRPKPRPVMDCWIDENGQLDGCRVKENDK